MATDKYIESAQNRDYKNWLNLAKFKQVDDFIILEGEHLCRAWLEHQGLPIHILLAENLLASGQFNDLWYACKASKRVILADKLAKSLSQLKHGIGVFFIVNKPIMQPPIATDADLVCLDRVQDPGNLGTLLRTAAAAGIKHAILSVGCASAWSPKVLRSAQGAHFALSIYESIDLHDFLSKTDLNISCTSLEQSRDLYQLDLKPSQAWVFGNEGQGVAAELIALCDTKINIPQSDQVESLNVAAAAAVCLFEQRRQRLLNNND